MKKILLIALCAATVGSSFFFSATASTLVGSEHEFYSDATYYDMIGWRGYGDCRGRWGVTSSYVLSYGCF